MNFVQKHIFSIFEHKQTLLAVIGEGFEDNSGLINGAVVQIRKRVDRLQLWTGKFPADDNAYQARWKI